MARLSEKKFLVKLEPENGNICALFDRVSEQFHEYVKLNKTKRKYYAFEEIRYGSKGAMIIALGSTEEHEVELKTILEKLRKKEEKEEDKQEGADTPKEYLKSFKVIAFETLLRDKVMDLIQVAEKLDDAKLDGLIQKAKG